MQTSNLIGTTIKCLSAKYSVFNTLTHRARAFCGNTQLLHKEEEHIKGAILMCGPRNARVYACELGYIYIYIYKYIIFLSHY